MSPWRAIQAAAEPVFGSEGVAELIYGPVGWFALAAVAATLLLNVHCDRPRASLESDARDSARRRSEDAEATANVHRAPGKVREVWDNPVLWREICTRAYGKKVLIIRLAYWVVFAVCFGALLYHVRGTLAARIAGRRPRLKA